MSTSMSAYYNEHDSFAAAWLRELIKAGHIAPGVVDERSILDVRPSDLTGFTQCHFFAGIGVWSHALRQAGWADDRPVWTGSCPCQPFSAAGRRAGFADERHLWPALHWLITQCRPGVVFGEQVASKDGLAWLDHVQADMENTGYACGTLDLCAAGFGAPHLRQRLWFVAKRLADTADRDGWSRKRATQAGTGSGTIGRIGPAGGRTVNWVGNPCATRLPACERESVEGQGRRKERRAIEQPGRTFSGADGQPNGRCSLPAAGPASPTNGYWRAADWLWCRDGKWRPVEPGTFPLADGTPGRVGQLRGYGNAIVAPVAQAFIEAYLQEN